MSDDLYPNELLRLIGRVIGLINMENCLLCLIWGTKINPWNGPLELLSYQHFLHPLILSRLSFVCVYLINWHFWEKNVNQNSHQHLNHRRFVCCRDLHNINCTCCKGRLTSSCISHCKKWAMWSRIFIFHNHFWSIKPGREMFQA